MSSSGSRRRKRRAPQAGELLDRWKSEDAQAAAEAQAELLSGGPAAIIPLLRTPDEKKYLQGPLPQITPVNVACAAVALNFFLVPFALTLGSSTLLLILLSTEVALGIAAWWNREMLRESAERLARKQAEHAVLAEEAMGFFEDPRWDDAILDGLLLKQSDGPDLVRPPDHPVYPSVKRVLARMDAQQAAVLLPKHRSSLEKFLHGDHFEYHEELVLLILEVVARFGDQEYLRKVNSIALQGVFNAVGVRIRAAAVRCAEQMEVRFENERTARVLLRPSDSVNAESGKLLHPAQTVEEDSVHLLRPTDNSTES